MTRVVARWCAPPWPLVLLAWALVLLAWAWALLIVLSFSGCAVLNPGSELPAPRAMTPHEYGLPLVAQAVAAADVVATGTVTRVTNVPEYGRNCHFPSQLQGCRAQDAWRVDVHGAARTWDLWAFPVPGQYLPIAPGMAAIFLAERRWLIPFARCEQLPYYANACVQTQGEFGFQIPDTLDILPLADSLLVDSLWHARRRP
jgi:hypothetical protein